MEENPRAQKAILNAVREQLASTEAPYVNTHYDRLIGEGLDEDEVLELLASVLAAEMWEMNTQKRTFNEALYIERLEKLPSLDWMDE